MGALLANHIKFNQASLRVIEKQINQASFQKEFYVYDTDSHLALRARPNQSYTDSVFCLYARIDPRGSTKSKMYKRQIMKVGDARNAGISVTDLRQRAEIMKSLNCSELEAVFAVADSVEGLKSN